ncbi:DUF3857 domain-containing protein [Algoriphagus sp. AK58]|uniref:DUF3857 domain-containing protein n=1 Tax=Algoriphagus sp. AK58 TaxID=1406877 RepID=UPI00164F0030|nr:DUF3857 domain-containing protein [Algoriphagus sp. AK58]MBC6365538.1 hypothetical protein [Algoriphagus sp. AK58]
MIKILFAWSWLSGLLVFMAVTATAEVPVHSSLVVKEVISIYPDYSYQRVIEKRLRVNSQEGLKHGASLIFYDKLNEIQDFEMEMTDAITGKSLKKARLKDLGDAALNSSSTFFDDNRYKYMELTSSKFPVDVTVRIQTQSKSNFFLPSWTPVPNYHQRVEKSVFQVRFPQEIGVKYKEINLPGEPTVIYQEGVKILEWTLEDLPVQAPDFEEDKDYKLILAPVKFALETYHGEMSDWAGLARWQYELNKGRAELPEEFKSKLREMVSGADEDYEKIKILYEFLQKNFRYVSIQLGIGGWQTMKAEEVLKYSYGDCKGLTNLMKAMLEAVGITSHYSLVFAGVNAKDIQVDFPSNQFNHVILYVPTDSNPIWLECTSNSLPAGYLGDFTKDRHVLVTTSDGGFLTKTPSYSTDQWNKITTISKLEIDLKGDAKVESRVTQSGNFAEGLLYVKNLKDEREQKEFFSTGFSVPGLVINQLKLGVEPKDSLLLADVVLEGYLQRFVQQTSKRFIIKSFMGKITPSKLDHNFLHQQDQLEIRLPEALLSDGSLPKVEVDEEHLKGTLTVTLDEDLLLLKRELLIDIPSDWTRSQKLDFVKKVNSAFDRSIFLSKPSTTISSN